MGESRAYPKGAMVVYDKNLDTLFIVMGYSLNEMVDTIDDVFVVLGGDPEVPLRIEIPFVSERLKAGTEGMMRLLDVIKERYPRISDVIEEVKRFVESEVVKRVRS